MRLIHIEVPAQPPDHNRPTAAKSSKSAASWSACSSASSLTPSATLPARNQALPLRAFAKFLDPLLDVILIAAAKILRAPLRPGDAHRLRRAVRTRPVHR